MPGGAGLKGAKTLTHFHHSFPKFLGGANKQQFAIMGVEAHKMLHRELNIFLKNIKNGAGKSMAPARGNSGQVIQRNFTPAEIKQALIDFYKGPGAKYKEAAEEFFKYIGFN